MRTNLGNSLTECLWGKNTVRVEMRFKRLSRVCRLEPRGRLEPAHPLVQRHFQSVLLWNFAEIILGTYIRAEWINKNWRLHHQTVRPQTGLRVCFWCSSNHRAPTAFSPVLPSSWQREPRGRRCSQQLLSSERGREQTVPPSCNVTAERNCCNM